MVPPKPEWLTRLFPWEQKALAVNGRRMAYIDEGDRAGRPVLLLSGNPTWGFLYREFIGPLTGRGIGRSRQTGWGRGTPTIRGWTRR